jgi:RNA-directed DNA polymerase
MPFGLGLRQPRGLLLPLATLALGPSSGGLNCRGSFFKLAAQSFFDTVNQEWLIRFLEHRIGDRRIIRLIRKWLKAASWKTGT